MKVFKLTKNICTMCVLCTMQYIVKFFTEGNECCNENKGSANNQKSNRLFMKVQVHHDEVKF